MSHASTEKQALAEEIITAIRTTVETMVAEAGPEEVVDGWNRGEKGAAWLDNELGMATQFLERMGSKSVFPDWSQYHTVRHVRLALEQSVSLEDLLFMHRFVVHHGGSNNETFFTLRDQSPAEIRAWFQNA